MIVSIGDAVVDLVATGVTDLPTWGQDREVQRLTPHRGGAGLNVAVNLAALGNTARLVAGVGADLWGDFLRREVAAAGVDGRGVVTLDAPTAVTVVLSGRQDRAFVSVYGATAAFALDEATRQIALQAAHIHLSGYWQSRILAPQLPALCETWREAGITISLDTGYDATEGWDGGIGDLLPHVDLFFPNETEACGIASEPTWEAALTTLAEVVPWVILKRGREGAVLQWGAMRLVAPAFSVPVVDTTGAGDAFNAGFLHQWLQTAPPDVALRYACAAGAVCVTREGASTQPPTQGDIAALLAQN